MTNPLVIISLASGALILLLCIGVSHFANGDSWKQTFKEWLILWGVIEILYTIIVWVVVNLR